MNIKGYLASLTYVLFSLSTTIINKYILSVLKFNYPFFLVSIQSFFICIFLLLGGLFGVVTLKLGNVKRWLIPSIFLNVMICTGTKTLQYLPVSLFTLFKNASIPIVSVLEYILFKRPISSLELISFILMFLSSYLGDSIGKISFIGYIWTFLNLLSTTIYVISLRYTMKFESESIVEAIFYPNLLAIPLIGSLSLVFEKIENVSLKLMFIVVISSICAFVTSLSTSFVILLSSSTTFAMLGASNKIFLGFSGMIFLGENVNKIQVFSLLLGALSTILFIKSVKTTKKS